MAQSKVKPNWETVPPRDWSEEQAHRVGAEVRRLRGKRSAQWVSKRTADMGCEVTRAVISDLEVGRRRYVTITELIMLALALDTAPIALLYPASYWENVHATPILEVPTIWAAQWFSGLLETVSDVPFDDEGRIVAMAMDAADSYWSNLLALRRAREAFHLDHQRNELRRELSKRRQLRDDYGREVSDEEIADLVADITDLQRRIDELRDLGDRPISGSSPFFPRGGDSDGR